MLLVSPGGTDGPERFCQEAHQTEPTRQHEQQGEEEDEELHDDETQSERQNKRQTLLQGETGRWRPSEWATVYDHGCTDLMKDRTLLRFSWTGNILFFFCRSLYGTLSWKTSGASRTHGHHVTLPHNVWSYCTSFKQSVKQFIIVLFSANKVHPFTLLWNKQTLIIVWMFLALFWFVYGAALSPSHRNWWVAFDWLQFWIPFN